MEFRLMFRVKPLAWLLAFWFAGALACRAVGPEVRDTAGLFSAAAVKQADEAIRGIQRDFRKDLLIETFAGVPENKQAAYEKDRASFFSDFVRERAQAARLDGIYVLVMKEAPPRRMHIQVGVGQATRARAFVNGDRDQLVQVLQTSFRDGKYDDGLRAGVAFVERTLRTNLGSRDNPTAANRQSVARTASRETPAPAPESSTRSTSVIGPILILGALIIGGILVIRLVIRLIRGATGGGGVPGPGGMMGGAGGGIFSGLLAGIGGALMGNWLYDRFTGGHSNSGDSWASSSADVPSDVGGDYASSGGDVGGDSDFGGMDSGGGGDFGGGGGDV